MTRTNRIFRDKTKWNKPIHENLCSRVIRVPFYSNMEQSSLRKSYLLLLALTLIYDLLFTLPPILLHFGIDADLIYKCFQLSHFRTQACSLFEVRFDLLWTDDRNSFLSAFQIVG